MKILSLAKIFDAKKFFRTETTCSCHKHTIEQQVADLTTEKTRAAIPANSIVFAELELQK